MKFFSRTIYPGTGAIVADHVMGVDWATSAFLANAVHAGHPQRSELVVAVYAHSEVQARTEMEKAGFTINSIEEHGSL